MYLFIYINMYDVMCKKALTDSQVLGLELQGLGCEGTGLHSFSSGDVYEGQWRSGVIQGLGKYNYAWSGDWCVCA